MSIVEHTLCPSRFSLLNRRDVLRRLLGGGVGLGMTAALPGGSEMRDSLAVASAASLRQAPAKGAIIRTVLKDVPPESLGAILFHEHLHHSQLAWVPGLPEPGKHFTEDFDVMVEELRAAAKEGVGCIVEAGHPDQGRRASYVRQLSIRSGLPVVMSGGFHSQRSYPPEVSLISEDDLVEESIRYAIAERWGALGEIGISAKIMPDERKVARAFGRTHVQTGIPLFTHTANGQAALEQLDLYESVGVKPSDILIGHLGNLWDPKVEVHKAVAKRGAYVGFDRVVIPKITPDEQIAQMVMAMIEAGYARNVLLSSDMGGFPGDLKANGGPGYAKTLTVFVPKLRKAGANETVIRQITVENPRRFLAFVPKNVSRSLS